MTATSPEVTYTAEGPVSSRGRRVGDTVVILGVEAWRNREMIARLVRREVSTRYRQFFLGPVWVLLQPAMTIGVFVMSIAIDGGTNLTGRPVSFV